MFFFFQRLSHKYRFRIRQTNSLVNTSVEFSRYSDDLFVSEKNETFSSLFIFFDFDFILTQIDFQNIFILRN